MGYWLELSSTIRQWADVIGLVTFVVGVSVLSMIGVFFLVRKEYRKLKGR